MKQFKLEGKQFNCPERWEDITLEQLLKINAGVDNVIEAISICTGLSQEELARSYDLVLMEELERTLMFLKDATGLRLELEPKEIVLNGVKVSPFSDIGKLPTAQYQDLKILIAEFHEQEGEEVDVIKRLSLYPKIVAIYLQPYIDNKEYDCEKADEYAKILYQHSAVEVSAWGYFFIRRFQELRNGILNDVQKSVTKPRNQKRGLVSYLKVLGSRLFSTTSRTEI